MVQAAELQQLTDSLWIWQVFDRAVRSDLFATAVRSGDRLFLVDPVPLAEGATEELISRGESMVILVTNGNHPRTAADFARRCQARIFCAPEVARAFPDLAPGVLGTLNELSTDLVAIPIEGAAIGEMAFHFPENGGTIVIGDALINLEPYGFALLPAKYCADQKIMRRSLRQLLELEFERLLFAHGAPIVVSAQARLETLLR